MGNIIYFVLGSMLIYEAVMDIRYRKITVIPVIITVLAGIISNLLFCDRDIIFIFCGALPGISLLVAARLVRGCIGYGDGVIIMAVGICLGAVRCLWILWLSLCFAGIAGVITILVKGKNIKTVIPFAPYIMAGYVIFYLFGTTYYITA